MIATTGSSESPYELLELIGQGSLGPLYRAHHTGLHRVEVITILSVQLAADEELVVRLRSEARASALLTHPNIVSVYGFSRLGDGRYYLAMENLEGETLESICYREKALSLTLCMRFAFQLASAIAHAHELGVVHRDINPANVMVEDAEGSAPYLKVLDFGLAKHIGAREAETLGGAPMGGSFGHPGYMAPERVRGVIGDPRIDIYSFGCVLYTMLTGQAPFVGRGIDVLHAHQDLEPTPPSEHRQVPSDVEEIVMCCLQKDPSERFGDGRELCSALHRVAGFSPEQARRRAIPPPPLPDDKQALGSAIDTDAHAHATTEHTEMDISETLASAKGHDSGREHAESGYYQALLRLGEALHEHGCREQALIRCLARLTRHRATLARYDEKLAGLLQLREDSEQVFRQKESELRAGLKECEVDRGNSEQATLEERVNDLTEEFMRADHLHRRELQAMLDNEIAEVAARERIVEGQREHYTMLLPLVDALLDEVAPEGELQEPIANFHQAKQAWQSTLRTRMTP